jgi:general secretion pathway protein D
VLLKRLIAGNDLADPEVMLEIEVLEVSQNRLQELGIQYPNQV